MAIKLTDDEKDYESLVIAREQKHSKSRGFRLLFKFLSNVVLVLISLALFFKYVCPNPSQFEIRGSSIPGVPEPLESAFLKSLETNLASNWSKKYTEEPHLAGQGLNLVNWTAEKFMEYGLETEIETFDIYLNYPVDNSLKLYFEGKNGSRLAYQASLKEDVLPDDPTTGGDDLVPAFHGYSASGNVTGQYVYVNYGRKEDFQLLADLNVDLTGKIAIARYGHIFRGLKVKFAQEAGCVGVLLYSDPGDDYFRESKGDKAYPEGPARNPSSLQRGSVQFLSQQPGDPTTPGVPSQGDVIRVDPHDSIPKIPSLPVSFKEIKPILEKLNGFGSKASKIGGDGWVGDLPGFEYWTGPNPEYTVNIYNNQSYDIVPIYNVYGNLTGTDPSEGYILIGNHRDAWIKGGASDPNSGSASMLEVIRGFHELTLQGWRPRKTIVFASWDGEEYALLGSTEFGEKNAKDLKANCLAYLNVDVSVSGKKLNIAASPFLNQVLTEALHLVEYPFGGSLFDHYFDRHEKFGILGSGSDFTVFQEHLGIPSVDMGFDSSAEDPVYHYHSNYDSYHWMSTMADPGFKLHNALAKYLGIVALKLTERKVIPTKIADYASELETYFTSLTAKVPDEWLSEPVSCRLGNISEAILSTEEKLNEFKTNATVFDDYAENLQLQWDNSKNLPFWKIIPLHYKIKGLNYKLRYFERNFLYKKGLKGRPWFKHIVYAAGRDTGYEGFALPGLKEALDDFDILSFSKWLMIINRLAKQLSRSYDYSTK
ncbi:LAFE_0H07844g1_1 [Lachancea fermentati]|uniref:LAFE_0H07844g1_1 n=1 Tax=Lachancea fermentati TaxID=4955 RepID=A0A1G4MJY2_LACFM|nr:LAFE_0H07844g1_1 [Lachancea fermentati]